ncbi:hypothetical protein FOMPIDRAFT_1147747, partial [Fomitopsis schrenkii]
MSFSDLSEDVLALLLRRLPDFNTLAAVIRSSKQLYSIFNAHPNSIKRKIAGSLCGHSDVLPAALRVVRADDNSAKVVPPQPAPEEDMLDIPMTRAEAELLDQFGTVVGSLEDLYSWRHKDRTSPISRLTPLESIRFKRGIYRFWLYCECYAPPQYDDGEDDSVGAAITGAAIEYLQSFAMDDCFEVAAAAAFCAELYEWNHRAYDPTSSEVPSGSFFGDHTCLGPQHILEDYRRVYCSHFEGAEDSGFFWESFEQVATRFKLKESRDDKLAHAIIVQNVSPNDSCHRCHAVRGIDLWGSTNWPLLRGLVSPAELRTLLPGHLPQNRFETTALLQYYDAELWLSGLTRSKADEIMANMMTELIDLSVDTGTDAWTQDGWYCLDCVRELLKQRLWQWWYAKKREAGKPEQVNCWYGWNCRT